MATNETQISAVISPATKALLDTYVRASGMKKGHVIEEALLHHLQAIHDLPADVIVHPRMVVSRASGERVLKRLRARRPTKALRRLMARDGD